MGYVTGQVVSDGAALPFAILLPLHLYFDCYRSGSTFDCYYCSIIIMAVAQCGRDVIVQSGLENSISECVCVSALHNVHRVSVYPCSESISVMCVDMHCSCHIPPSSK